LITDKEIKKIFKPITSDTHKGKQGHALLIGGSFGKIGAMVLASKACLKSGCGLVSVFIPKCGYAILQTANPEVMVICDKKFDYISKIEFYFEPQAIGIGPGMGQERDTKKAFYHFLKNNKVPLVVDADGLNILAANKKWLALLPSKTIITPHLKELERLIGSWQSEDEKFEIAKIFSKENDLIIVMKGAPTFIIDADKIYKNTTGNAALATAGSGDVLTGIIASLLAQGYEAIDASILGVYLHGLTADLAFPETGHQAFIASTIIKYLGKAFLTLEKS